MTLQAVAVVGNPKPSSNVWFRPQAILQRRRYLPRLRSISSWTT